MEKNIDIEKYCPLASRVIELDEDMTAVAKSWKSVWASIQDHHLKGEDLARRQRIRSLQELIKGIQNSTLSMDNEISLELLKAEISKIDDRNDAWVLLCHTISQFSDYVINIRNVSNLTNENCPKCKAASIHFM